jgi:acyl-CoA thioester hydrolase
MPAIYEHELVVRQDDIDVWGHVNNLVYLRWMQDAAVAHSAARGWPTSKYLELGAGWVVRSHQIEYRQPAFVDEPIVVRTWIANFKKIQSLRKYQILRADDDTVLAVAETNWAFIGLEHRVPRRVPGEIIDSFVLVEPANEPSLPRQYERIKKLEKTGKRNVL